MSGSVLLISLEGVLADTAPLLRSALRESLSVEGLHLSDAEWVDHCQGLGISESVRRLLAARGDDVDPTATELIGLRAERRFTIRAGSGLSMRPGANSLLLALGGRARVAVVTRLPRQLVDYVLDPAGLQHTVQCVVAAEDLETPGPSRNPHELGIERLERSVPVDRSSAIALEGSAPGIESARAAGLWCLAVGPIPAWQRMGADAWIEELEGATFPDIIGIARSAR